MSTLYDTKAVKILFDTYWTAKGWRQRPFSTASSDLSYAISKGVMFPAAVLTHDATQQLQKLCSSISPSHVGDAFLVSLGSRELALRSALGSFAVARFLPVHEESPILTPAPLPASNAVSTLPQPQWMTGQDLNVLNFERLKWGGVRHTDMEYEVFDLEQFQKLAPSEPKDEDVAIFHGILAAIRTLPPNATVGHFEKALPRALRSNKSERRQLIEVLCLCGVLAYPGYRNYFDRTEPPKGCPYRDSDWGFPAMYWRAQDGYNIEHLKEYFPRYASKLATA